MSEAEVKDIFGSKNQGSKWRSQGGYMMRKAIVRFWAGEGHRENSHSTFEETAEILANFFIQEKEASLLDASKKLLEQQRHLENTRARRRLERWATRVISYYLIAVFCLIIANGVCAVKYEKVFISDYIMAVILGTTAVNIIGLGLIVLKGHFETPERRRRKLKATT